MAGGRRTRSKKAEHQEAGDAPVVKKIKRELPLIDGIQVRFEWEGDGAKWVQYSQKFNRLVTDAYNAQKKQVDLSLPNGVILVINLDRMVQINKKTGWERRIQAALKSDGEDDFVVLQWEDDKGKWNPYPVSTSVQANKALMNKQKSLKIKTAQHEYEIDLENKTQTNTKTKTVRMTRWKTSASEIPPDYADDDDEEEEEVKEEEEEKEVKATKSAKGKGKSNGKSAKGKSGGESSAKSSVRTVVMKKGVAPVDDQCPVANKTSVYEARKTVWDCMLNQTNISNNNNKYYLIQLLETGGGSPYYVWQRWGRVGYSGQNNLLPCGSDLDKAMTLFAKKFRDKTGNDWSLKESFSKVSGKYDLLKMDYSAEGEDQVDATVTQANDEDEPVTVPDSKLDQKLQDLVKLICDVKSMEEAVVEMKYDAKKAPLGKLTKSQIKAGYSALQTIEGLIKKNDTGRNLSEACSDFYTRIPHEFGMQVPPLIRTPQMVKEKIQLLEALEDIEIAIKMLKGGDMSENPIDRHYHQLNCQLDLLKHNSGEFELLQKYLTKTHAATHNQYKMELLEVFQCDRDGEAKSFQDYGNRMLLWHGSRLTNCAGILGQGLRIAPPEAPVTGYMFGKGVYFADMSSKSANYCFATKTKNIGLLLLCDVSLGNMEDKLCADYNADKLPKGKHSVRGLGRIAPDPTDTITMSDGIQVPVGKGKDTGVINPNGYTLNYNEFIVYNTQQIRMKYILLIKFHFK